jgi:hypothetical protein
MEGEELVDDGPVSVGVGRDWSSRPRLADDIGGTMII